MPIWIFILFFSIQSFCGIKKSQNFSAIEEKVLSFMLADQRALAIVYIDENYNKTKSGSEKQELLKIKYNLLNQFIDSKTVEKYESALFYFLKDRKKANQFIQECLEIEKENFQCQWLYLKYTIRYKSSETKDYGLQLLKQIENIPNFQLEIKSLKNLLRYTENSPQRKSNPLENNLNRIQQFELAYLEKNLEVAQKFYIDLVGTMQDSPDLIYFASLLEKLKNGEKENSQQSTYLKRCRDLNSEVFRKYNYDLFFCSRGFS